LEREGEKGLGKGVSIGVGGRIILIPFVRPLMWGTGKNEKGKKDLMAFGQIYS